jgi:hypothetical protein
MKQISELWKAPDLTMSKIYSQLYNIQVINNHEIGRLTTIKHTAKKKKKEWFGFKIGIAKILISIHFLQDRENIPAALNILPA